MLTLAEVIAGLKEGRSFKREDDAGTHTVEPAPDGYFTHTWMSSDAQGGGGRADLPLAILENGRWDEEGWVETKVSSDATA